MSACVYARVCVDTGYVSISVRFEAIPSILTLSIVDEVNQKHQIFMMVDIWYDAVNRKITLSFYYPPSSLLGVSFGGA